MNCPHAVLLCLVSLSPLVAAACERPLIVEDAKAMQVRAFFQAEHKKVVTFLGYSGAGYEDRAAMLQRAAGVLDRYQPASTIVNIGATPEGIGAVYEIAKQKGFRTAGVVSSQARDSNTALAPCVDVVFYVQDATWGGFLPGTLRLSPTSAAMIENSDVVVAIGGGAVARDELMVARKAGKKTRFFPADMDHHLAIEKAGRNGQRAPTDFRGAAGIAFRKR